MGDDSNRARFSTGAGMTSLDRMLSLLAFFDERQMSLGVPDAERITGASRSTAYRYLHSLVDAGLLAATVDGMYVLGPRVLELERLMRENDPLISAARGIIRRRAEETNINVMLCSHYGSRVLCTDFAWPDRSLPEIYQRGRSMPIFRGAMAKAILANLKPYQLRQLYRRSADDIRDAGLAASWDEFRGTMAGIRKAGVVVTRGEVFAGLVGIAAPVKDQERRVLGSVVFVIGAERFGLMNEERLVSRLLAIAAEIEEALSAATGLLDAPALPPMRLGRPLG
jgi:DNA-binding IclR family transcriptional regulator